VASIAHVAVGLLAGRLHGGASARAGERCSGGTLVFFGALAVLPDADVFLVALGTSDTGPVGHRGASHSFLAAAMIGVLCAFATRKLGWPAMRTALAGTLAVASHAVLDVLGEGGRGLPLFWPFSETRFESPVRLFPDAPRGLGLISRTGLVNVVVEFVMFLPVMVYALWPNLAPWRRRRQAPVLTLIEGGAVSAPILSTTTVPTTAETIQVAAAPAATAEAEAPPPLRSNG
jgi:inner membrane protein